MLVLHEPIAAATGSDTRERLGGGEAVWLLVFARTEFFLDLETMNRYAELEARLSG
jgi:hypothetical protein